MFFAPAARPAGAGFADFDSETPDGRVFFFDVGQLCPALLRVRIDAPLSPESGAVGREERQQLIQTRCLLDCRYVSEVLARLRRPAPCLCCCHTLSAAQAAELSQQLGEVRCYLSYGAFSHTGAQRRVTDALARPLSLPPSFDLSGEAWREVPTPVRRALRACRRIGHEFGWCIRTGEVWFSDRPEVGRLLRQIARLAKKSGCVLRVRAPSVRRLISLPRPGAVRSVEYHRAGSSPPPPGGPPPPEPVLDSDLWLHVSEAARRYAESRKHP